MGLLSDIVAERTTPEGQFSKIARDVRDELSEMSGEELSKLAEYIDAIEEEEQTKEAADEAVAAGVLMSQGLQAGLADRGIDLADLGEFVMSAKEAGVEPEELGYKVAIACALVDELLDEE